MEGRRGSPALFTAPKRYRHLENSNLWWQRQLLQYVFRLKPDKEQMMQQLYKEIGLESPSIGLHIRHGDLNLKYEYGDKAGERAYMNRPYFEYEDYFTKMREAIEKGDIPLPKSIYIATDGQDIESAIERERLNPIWSEAANRDNDPQYAQCVAASECDDERFSGTKFIILDRYRNVYGAHTSSTLMALPHSAKRELSKLSDADRALNFRAMLQEAIEDIWLLSKCDYIFGTGSSHFSALAAYLRVYRIISHVQIQVVIVRMKVGPHGAPPHRSIFLDASGLELGEFCPGLFHGSINGTAKLLRPHERHHIMQKRFLDRLHVQEDLHPQNAFHFDVKRSHYVVPTHTFDSEASRWVDAGRSRVWEWVSTDSGTLYLSLIITL